MAAQFKRKLAKMASTYKKAMARESEGFSDLEDGVYLMAVEAVMHEADSGRFGILWTFTVQEGESEGQTQRDFDGLETEDNFFWTRMKLERMGYEMPDDITELEDLMADLSDKKPIVRGKVETKDDYTHVRVRKLVASEGGVGSDSFEPEKQGGDEPSGDGDGEEELVFEEGVGVTFIFRGKPMTGVIEEIIDDESCKVKCTDGKVRTKDFDDLEIGEPEPEAGNESDLEVGTDVTVVDGGETYTGKVVSQDGDTVTIDFGELGEEEWPREKVDVVEPEPPAEPEPAEPTIEVGSKVTVDDDGITYEGTVTELDDNSATVDFGEFGEEERDLTDLTLVAEGGGDVGVGAMVSWEYRGKTRTGKVTEVLDGGLRVRDSEDSRIKFLNDGDYEVTS